MRLTLANLLVCVACTGCATTETTRSDGWQLLQRQDYEGALASFERKLEQSDDAALYAGRARALCLLGRQRDARRDYEEALRREPDNAQWYVGLGVVCLASGDLREAVAACDAALRLDPNHANAHFNRGCAHLQMHAFDEALIDFSQALRVAPDLAAAYNSRGVVFAHTGRLDAAIEDFRRAAQLTPFAAAHGNCAAAYYARGDVQLALSELNAAIRLERSNPLHYFNRGRIYLDLGQADMAAAEFEQGLALSPSAGEGRELLAQARSAGDAHLHGRSGARIQSTTSIE